MYFLTGFTDEAADSIEDQIRVVQELGWSHLELRAVGGVNAHDLPENEFDHVRRTIEASGLQVSCLGTNIANWGASVETPIEETLATVSRVIERAKALEVPYARVMSYALLQDGEGNVLEDQQEKLRFKKLRTICTTLKDAGITPVHENCFTYGGMSWEHTLRLIDEVPGLKLAFDTGNPALQHDYSKPAPRPFQSPWEFYTKVKAHIEYVHIKDARLDTGSGEEHYFFPGEGAGEVRRIVADLLSSGYDGGFSMEPHMAVVYHDASVSSKSEVRYANFLEYGTRFMGILTEIGYPYTPAGK